MIETLFSVIRLISSTKFRKTKSIKRKSDQCLIMGNGPSLIESLKRNEQALQKIDLVAVNFMGLSPEYGHYKPTIYVLCDPAFWFENISQELEQKVIKLYETIALDTNWHLQLYLPYQAKREKKISLILSQNKNVNLEYYNKTKFEGYTKLNYWIYNRQLGMPRVQNVLVSVLMLTIYSKYKKIYLAGADNDWIKNLWVDEENNLCLNDFHYYKDTNVKYILPNKLHEQCASFYFAFKSYMDIEKYAVYSNVKIYNVSMSSFIDAFEKKNRI